MKLLAGDRLKTMAEHVRQHGIMLAGLLTMYIIFVHYIYNNVILENTGLSIAAAVLGFLIFAFAGVCAVRFEARPHQLYLIVFLLIGMLYFFVYPVGTVPDEFAHFYRAYEISEGHLVSDIRNGMGGRELPDGLALSSNTVMLSLQKMWGMLGNEISEERSWYTFWTMSLYAPVSYIPQSLGIFVARLFTDSVLVMFMAGRLLNFIAVAIVSYFAVKYIPIGKKAVILIMLLPVNMQEAISLAPDAMVTALTLAFIAFILHLRYKQESAVSVKQLVVLYVMAVFISLYKIVYLPFCMLPFLIQPDKLGGRKKFTIHAICMGALVIVASLGWLMFAGRYLMDIEGGRNSDDQVAYILSDLPNYFKIMLSTIKTDGLRYIYTMLGQELGWLNIYVPKGYMILYGIVLLTGIFSEGAVPGKFGFVRGIFAVIIVAVFLLIMTSLYVQWNDYAAESITGVQGRYFIPLLLPLFLLVGFCIPHAAGRLINIKNLIAPVLAVNLIAVAVVFNTLALQKADWEQDEHGWRYNVYESGYVTGEWKQIGLVWYYFDDEGYALSEEWLLLDGARYYFAKDCSMLTGWHVIDGEYYYLDNDGTAFTGWVESGGEWYYCEDGKMLYDCVTPDGYRLDGDGKRIQ